MVFPVNLLPAPPPAAAAAGFAAFVIFEMALRAVLERKLFHLLAAPVPKFLKLVFNLPSPPSSRPFCPTLDPCCLFCVVFSIAATRSATVVAGWSSSETEEEEEVVLEPGG